MDVAKGRWTAAFTDAPHTTSRLHVQWAFHGRWATFTTPETQSWASRPPWNGSSQQGRSRTLSWGPLGCTQADKQTFWRCLSNGGAHLVPLDAPQGPISLRNAAGLDVASRPMARDPACPHGVCVPLLVH